MIHLFHCIIQTNVIISVFHGSRFMFFYTQSSKKRCVFFDQRFRTVHGMVSSYLYKLPAALRTETVSFMHETLRLNNPGHLHSCLPLQKNVIYLYSMGADSCSSIIKVPRNVVSFLINAFVQSMEWFRALCINFLQRCGPKRFRSCMKLFALTILAICIHVFHYRQM